METTTVSVLTETLVNILLGSYVLISLSWAVVGIQTIFSERKRRKRDEEAAKRDEEYHQMRMKALTKE